MDVRDYEYIVTIADQGSISKAAEQLFITQPALTKFLQRIEKELGLALFVRNGKQFHLTEAGQQYVEAGHEILRLDRKLTEQLMHDRVTRGKRIRIGIAMGRFFDVTESVFPAFRRDYPDVDLYVSATTSRRQFEELQRGELDFAIVTNLERRVGYEYIPIDQAYLSVAVPEDDPLRTQAVEMEGYPFPVIDGKLLKGRPFIMLHGNTNSGHLTRELLRRHGFRPNIIMELNDVRSAIDMVAQGTGISMLMSVPVGNRRVCYLSLKNTEIISQEVFLTYRADTALTEPMRHLISLLRPR